MNNCKNKGENIKFENNVAKTIKESTEKMAASFLASPEVAKN